MAEVELHHVRKVFPGGSVAVDDVSLTALDEEFLVLVGPSGCGKSTVLRIIAGLEDETSGTVSIGGTVVNGMPPKQRDIAMVFQNYALYPHMSVEDNMAFALQLRHLPHRQIDELVLATARVLGLDELLGRKPKTLSGGQRQRVAMGRAIVRQPRVFLMDEPLSNLDAKLRVAMRAELRRLHSQHRVTTVYVTHDQIEAMTLGDRIVVMDQGRLQQIGTPHQLYHDPKNIFVAGFIGAPGMNFARARLPKDGTPALAVGDHRWPLSAGHPNLPHSLAGGLATAVVLGLRPDAFVWPAPADRPHLRVTAIGVEALGHENHVLFAAPRDEDDPGSQLWAGVDGEDAVPLWTAKVDAHCPVMPGEEITFGVNLDAAHYFDPASQLSMSAHDVQAEQAEAIPTPA
jgi:multiple sugar transport system ATP-binding protein